MQQIQTQPTDTYYFPHKLTPLNKSVEITTPISFGVTAKIYLHETARKLPLYQQKINCTAFGSDKTGNLIKIDSLGRWLFGVPGYQGNVRIVAEDKKIILFYPENSPESVHQLIQLIKQEIEKKVNNINV